MALRGTFDGQRYEDIRILIPKNIQDFYKERDEWDRIIKYRSYEKCEAITVQRRHTKIRHTWYLVNKNWTITKDEVV